MAYVNSVSDANFQKEVLEAVQPVLVDFWASWCGPCRALAPKIEEIAKQFEGRVKVLKMDVDANQSTPAQFGIRGIPTLLLFKNGQVIDQLVGNQPKEVIEGLLNRAI